MLTKLELKKIFKRKTTKGSIIIMVIFLFISIYASISNILSFDLDKDGDHTVTGLKAISVIKKDVNSVSGDLTPKRISEVIETYKELKSNPKNLLKSGDLNDEVFVNKWKKYNDINSLISSAYSRTYDYDIIDKLSPKDGEKFYLSRLDRISEELNDPSKDKNYSKGEREKFIELNKKLETPFKYGYSLGWENILGFLGSWIMCIIMLVCVSISPVFSSEYDTGADSIILSTKYGKNKVIYSKFKASLIFTTIVYFTAIIACTLITLSIFGFDGFNLPLQINSIYFESHYAVSFIGAYLLVLIIGYMACMLISSIALFISAKFKSQFMSIIITTSVTFLPLITSERKLSRGLQYMLDLFPINMTGDSILKSYKLYNVFGNLVLQHYVMIGVCIIASLILLTLGYKSFRNHQVA